MEPNLTPIILNATLTTQPPQGITLIASAAIGAGSAIIASIVSSLTYYYIEKRRAENETRKLLRKDRKTHYANLYHELSEFHRNYLSHFSSLSAPSDEYRNWLYETNFALSAISDKFATEIELTGNLEIGKLLRETYRLFNNFYVSFDLYINPPEDYIPLESDPDIITNSDIYEIEDKLGEIIRLMRVELMPLQEEKNKSTQREYWWEKQN